MQDHYAVILALTLALTAQWLSPQVATNPQNLTSPIVVVTESIPTSSSPLARSNARDIASQPSEPKGSEEITSTPDNSGEGDLPVCVQTDCNCSDFTTQQQAQAVLDAFPGDPHRLDANKNGIACDRLSK